MDARNEIIHIEQDNTLSFGEYTTKDKKKLEVEVGGHIYKIKTHDQLTRLEKNGNLLFEAVPGVLVKNFNLNEHELTFNAEGFSDTQITLELEPESEYKIYIDNSSIGSMKSNLSGKINFSLELNEKAKAVKVEKA